MQLTKALAGLYFLGAVGWGCSEPEYSTSRSVEVTVDTLDGVEHVRSIGEPTRWTVNPVLALGSPGLGGTAEADEFSFVSSVAFRAPDSLYVADLRRDQIKVFDREGTLLGIIGRSGKGPGEFESIYSIAWMGDTLLTLDVAGARLGLFSRTGEWLGSRPAMGRLAASAVTNRLYRVGPREVYQWAYRADDGLTESTWRRHAPNGIESEWHRGPNRGISDFPQQIVCRLERGVTWIDHPLVQRRFEIPAQDEHVFVARSDQYRIMLVDPEGDTVQVIERHVPEPIISEGEWETISARFDEWFSDKNRAECTPSELIRPESKPYFRSVLTDVEGRLWIERNLDTGTAWEVFDRSGRLIAQVDGFDHDYERTVPWLSTEFIAWIERDSLDVPTVKLAELQH